METGTATTKRLLGFGLAIGAALLLSACGSDLGGGGSDAKVTVAKANGKGQWRPAISQWPLYIDREVRAGLRGG